MSGELDPGQAPPSPARGIAGQVVANTSLLIAVLVYMGWAWDDAFYGYFHISPIDLNVGIVEYMLRSLALFSTGLVVAAVGVIVVTAVRAWDLGRTRFGRLVADQAPARISLIHAFRPTVLTGNDEQSHVGRLLLIGAGSAITAAALVLVWRISLIPVNTYVLLALLGCGPLLLTWPTRTEPHGRFPYSLAIVVAAVCALWAASLYAHGAGIRAAQAQVRSLPTRAAVVVYSIQRLALSGPGVNVEQLPSGFRYHYRYTGLRLLLTRSGTYYLLPVGWNQRLDLTYIISQDDQIRIELRSGVLRPNS